MKELEENGIGRPSTYAAIISTILDRGYVDARQAPAAYRAGFHGKRPAGEAFRLRVQRRIHIRHGGASGRNCAADRRWPRSCVPSTISSSRSCARRSYHGESGGDPEKAGEACPDCGGDLVIKQGRFGKFIGCTNYPTCRHTGRCGQARYRLPTDGGDLADRDPKRPRLLRLRQLPGVRLHIWKRPLPTRCTHCGGLMVVAARSGPNVRLARKRTKPEAQGTVRVKTLPDEVNRCKAPWSAASASGRRAQRITVHGQ